jgi:hypothetical protein
MNHSTRGDITMGYVRPGEADLLHWAGVIEAAILNAADATEDRQVIALDTKRSRAVQ